MRAVRDVRDTRTGRDAKTKDEGVDRPGVWSAYGVLLQYLRKRAGLNQQQLGDAMGYSLEQVASVEQGRRPAKAAFTMAAERALEAGGVLEALQGGGGPDEVAEVLQELRADRGGGGEPVRL